MQIAKVYKADTSNGVGFRTVLWTQGCNFHCPECHNQELWDYSKGIKWNKTIENKIVDYIKNNPYIDGLSLLGGEPLSECNLAELEVLCKRIKDETGKTVWCWTGNIWEKVKDMPIIKYIDVLVDGLYEKDKRDLSLKWRGSSNQRVIDVQKSLKDGKVVLYCD